MENMGASGNVFSGETGGPGFKCCRFLFLVAFMPVDVCRQQFKQASASFFNKKLMGVST